MDKPDCQIIYHNDRPAFAVIPYDQFEAMMRRFVDLPKEVPPEIRHFIEVEGMTWVKAWRTFRNLTQADVADLMGISQPAFAQMEKCVASLQRSTMEKLAKALKVDVKQLMD